MENLKNKLTDFFKGTDLILIFLCLIASLFGCLFVQSATLSTLTEDQTLSRDTTTMIIAVCVGIVIALIISKIDYEIILKLWPIIADIGGIASAAELDDFVVFYRCRT